jgi:hypothetical protein
VPLRTSANTLLENVDNGFDIERPQEGDWLSFRRAKRAIAWPP